VSKACERREGCERREKESSECEKKKKKKKVSRTERQCIHAKVYMLSFIVCVQDLPQKARRFAPLWPAFYSKRERICVYIND